MSTLVTTALRHNTSASNNVTLDSNGRVGIGTAAPGYQLTVVGGGGVQISPGTSAQEGIRIQRASGICSLSGINNDNNAFNALAFFTGASEAVRIDTSRRVTKPGQPMFYARGAESNYTLTNGADIPFNNAVFNNGSHYNASTFRFTAPVAGYYFIAFHLFVQTASNRVSIKVNNAAYNNNQMNVNAGTNSWAGVMFLNANDFVSVGDWQSVAGATFYMGHSTFSGFLLG